MASGKPYVASAVRAMLPTRVPARRTFILRNHRPVDASFDATISLISPVGWWRESIAKGHSCVYRKSKRGRNDDEVRRAGRVI
jgi:hypothetical protein